MDSYITIKERSHFEYEDRKSVFIGEAIPVSCESDALAFIQSVKKKYPDARHHVYAYVLRENSIMRFTDDSEPQGTAGMPVLDVIRKNGCTDTVIVVTRYFGGTLLGTGGLVHAYTAAALGALREAQIIRYDLYTELALSLSYSDHSKITTFLDESGFRVLDTAYFENVVISGKIISSMLEGFIEQLTELTSGRAEIKILEEKFDF